MRPFQVGIAGELDIVRSVVSLMGLIVLSTLSANTALQVLFFAGWTIFFRSMAFTLVISLAVVGPVVFVFCKLYRALYLAKLDVERLSRRDTLTGIANRLVLMERLAAVRGPAVLAILDIDHFKLVNDRYGHPTGDTVLVSVARCLERRLGAIGCLARIGGEEFAVLAEGVSVETVVQRLDEARREVEENAVATSDGSVSVTISIGVAGGTTHNSGDLYAAADAALYLAKASGRNAVHVAGTPIVLYSEDLIWAETAPTPDRTAAA